MQNQGVSVGQTVFVFFAGLVTALATGLGALPFVFGRRFTNTWLGPANALAGGVMLGASAALLIEGADRNAWRTVLGVALGVVFIAVTAKLLGGHDDLELGSLRGADAQRALLIVGVMTVHSGAEGIGVGASFGPSQTFGIIIALAIALQNIPEGLAISLVLVPRGTRVRSAAWWSIFSSLPQPLLAVPAYLFVATFAGVLPAALGFAAGAMVWMVMDELIPDALEHSSRASVAGVTTVSFGAMLALELLVSS
ncbi:MAG: ZIP family metal transporter [Actinobacteria bacterium]|uniref:Unannotated protein n=1 Tax=freshwater metagenome TaxID=449393 RepID=A0A6J6NYF7_9ZZZZ|nr:ZIP family metal transporter [Actinomycetota bacterium]